MNPLALTDPPLAAPAEFPNHFGEAPSHQSALDLFRGEWTTRLPDRCGLVAGTGPARHCEDYRIEWAELNLSGFAGKRVLELGPMEGGHAYMLEQMQAREVIAIEANSRAYLKCLVMKEVFGLTRTRYLLGDFIPYLHSTRTVFDVGLACGVLYHLPNPVEAIRLLAQRCRAVFVWTHYHDPDFIAARPEIGQYFHPPVTEEVGGYRHTLHRKNYGPALRWKGFCGGGSTGCWLPRADVFGALEHFGFKITQHFDEKNPHGPALLITAENTRLGP